MKRMCQYFIILLIGILVLMPLKTNAATTYKEVKPKPSLSAIRTYGGFLSSERYYFADSYTVNVIDGVPTYTLAGTTQVGTWSALQFLFSSTPYTCTKTSLTDTCTHLYKMVSYTDQYSGTAYEVEYPEPKNKYYGATTYITNASNYVFDTTTGKYTLSGTEWENQAGYLDDLYQKYPYTCMGYNTTTCATLYQIVGADNGTLLYYEYTSEAVNSGDSSSGTTDNTDGTTDNNTGNNNNGNNSDVTNDNESGSSDKNADDTNWKKLIAGIKTNETISSLNNDEYQVSFDETDESKFIIKVTRDNEEYTVILNYKDGIVTYDTQDGEPEGFELVHSLIIGSVLEEICEIFDYDFEAFISWLEENEGKLTLVGNGITYSLKEFSYEKSENGSYVSISGDYMNSLSVNIAYPITGYTNPTDKGDNNEDKIQNPDTGDLSIVAIAVAALVCATGAAFAYKKRFNS